MNTTATLQYRIELFAENQVDSENPSRTHGVIQRLKHLKEFSKRWRNLSVSSKLVKTNGTDLTVHDYNLGDNLFGQYCQSKDGKVKMLIHTLPSSIMQPKEITTKVLDMDLGSVLDFVMDTRDDLLVLANKDPEGYIPLACCYDCHILDLQ